uniref:Uncharacterized protein n=1 Tax=Onchocerca volvulus TaxID=6282 RepID=A0A8R1XQK3_ONCVO
MQLYFRWMHNELIIERSCCYDSPKINSCHFGFPFICNSLTLQREFDIYELDLEFLKFRCYGDKG